MKSTIFVVLICSSVLAIHADPIDKCSVASSCDACLAEPTCAWCFDPQTISTPRCLDPASHYIGTSESVCREEYLYHPMNLIAHLKARDFRYLPAHSASSSSYSERNFISPEHVRASIRIGNEIRLNTNYVVNEDFPVDIYLVMDMRNPRENKNQQLNSLAWSIVDAMRNITSDFRVGLGYISGSSRPIIHHTSMSIDRSALLHSVEQLVAGELPVSEGAPLGAIVETACSGNIGWRPQSQKIIVFATDRDYEGHHSDNHVNVRQTNTGFTSHICSRDFNSQSIQTVYQPSEISDLLNEKQIHVVFVVTDNVAPTYQELGNLLGHSAVTRLSTDTSNVGNLLENLYMSLSLDIYLTDNSSNFLSVRYFTKCLTEVETETNECRGVKMGDRITFGIQLELLSCPANSKDWNQKLEIRPKNLNGHLTVDLKFYCACPVEIQGCSGNGHFVNGVCQCNGDYFGDNCECVGKKPTRNDCRANDTVVVDCSGRGTCVCGHCLCDERGNSEEHIYGRYCEIDNYSCARGSEEVCSGRGSCIHGECVCFEDWEGAVCNSKKKTCKSPTITAECSGHGTCENETCTCLESTVGRYYGEHCDKYELKQQGPECLGNGRLVNGQCVCNENYFGSQLEEVAVYVDSANVIFENVQMKKYMEDTVSVTTSPVIITTDFSVPGTVPVIVDDVFVLETGRVLRAIAAPTLTPAFSRHLTIRKYARDMASASVDNVNVSMTKLETATLDNIAQLSSKFHKMNLQIETRTLTEMILNFM
ncbi:myospheroid [Carabus blaptoides fortunei]